MGRNVTQKLIAEHLVEGAMEAGREIGIRIDQTLTQDATGTLVMLQLEAIGLDRVRTRLSAQYVDHNLIQADHKNADDHLFLESACRRFGIWYSRPGNGVSHPVHQERFGTPGATLLGSDSHTPAAGGIGMLAIGAGGVEVALAMAGEPFRFPMPEILGVRLEGELPPWVSAKDVILEMLRRYDVDGCHGKIVEYHGPGLASLSAMDRHVIANMGTEMGATTTVFPSDQETLRFLRAQGRGGDWSEWSADPDAGYDARDEIDLSELEPLIALPSSPGNVVPITEVEGRDIYQAYLGSSANPGFRDFAVPALMVEGRRVHPSVSFDVNPTSRRILEQLSAAGHLGSLIRAGARIHQAGCNGCIGMGQAPATGRNSLRTVPRNFPGRSGVKEDAVYLCSPESATASALHGRITDPRRMGDDMAPPRVREPEDSGVGVEMLVPPPDDGGNTELVKGPNIHSLPELAPLDDRLEGPVLLKAGDNVSTDEILPAGTRVLPFRSNIPAISRFTFEALDEHYWERAEEFQMEGHMVVGGWNYGQGSSREHAALAPRYLGVRAVLARSFARIHLQNLANYGVLPLVFQDPDDWERIRKDDVIRIAGIRKALGEGNLEVEARNRTRDESYRFSVPLSARQREMVLAGSVLNLYRKAPGSSPPGGT
jgi:aconitate hydratase